MSKSGVITEKSKENKAYHNVIVLFKIYRSVSWRMQVRRAGGAPFSEGIWDGCGQLSGIYLSGRDGLK